MRGIFTALALMGCVAAAHAEGSPGTKAEQAACRADVRKFCATLVKADPQQYRDCLQFHFSDLSQKCQQTLMNHQNQ